MSFKPDEKDWMAYLYGELEDDDRQKFDQYILEDADARAELRKLQKLRAMLSTAKDKEVIAPSIFVGDRDPDRHLTLVRMLWNAPYVRTVVGIAASLLLIILAGKLSGTELTVSNHEFRLSFGRAEKTIPPPSVESRPPLSQEQVQQMINHSLNNNNSVMQAGLTETQKKLDASIRKSLALSSRKIDRLVQEASAASQQQISQFADGIRTENMQQVKDYFQLTSTEQKKYIENLLVDFSQYLQQQRTNDLQLVQTRMSSLEQNTNIFKQETEQILSSIITTVGNTNSGETKN